MKAAATPRQIALAEARSIAKEHGLTFEELQAVEPRGPSAWERQRRIALDHCRQMVEFWRIRPAELRGARLIEPAPKGPKYRHPVSGETWDGEGFQPDWLKHALLREGYTVDELRVQS